MQLCHACSATLHGGPSEPTKGEGLLSRTTRRLVKTASDLMGNEANNGHCPLQLSAVLNLKRKARAARLRVLLRAGADLALHNETEVEWEGGRAGAPGTMMQFSEIGAQFGSAFPSFGARAAGTLHSGHAPLYRALGAPLGFHHAKRLLIGLSGARARRRWRAAYAAIQLARSPWRRMLAGLHSAVQVSAPGAFSFLEAAAADGEERDAPVAVDDAEACIADLMEGRFASLERYVSFLVMFHAMALRVANTCWPLPPWDLSRSQSILRVASTAAPVSGAEVAEQLAKPK
jgi:hypothetical protein